MSDKTLTTTPAITPMHLLQLAMDKGADLDRLERLMDLDERWRAQKAKSAYVEAMANFLSNVPEIIRTKKAHNSNYAGLAETLEQIKKIMSEFGLSHSWKIDQQNNLITVTCFVTHIDGHSECTSLTGMPDSSGSKNSIQAIGSTVSYLQRYTLFAILGLASKDQDTDGIIKSEPLSESQVCNIQALAQEVDANIPAMLKWLKVESIEEITKNKYSQVIAMLEKKRGSE